MQQVDGDARPVVVDATMENFSAEVIERSREVPVVVDFWATWCGPCRILGPILEQLAAEGDGKFALVKAETERVPDLAASFGVRSIPAVFGVVDGRIVDSFVGALPEAAIRTWIDRLMPSPADLQVREARALEAIDPGRAEELYAAVLGEQADDPRALVGLGRIALAAGRLDEAQGVLDRLNRRGFLEPEAETFRAELTLQAHAGPVGDLDALRAAVDASPGDHAARLRLAEALAAAARYDEALPLALDLVEVDRRNTGEEARKLMVAAFQVLPPDSALTQIYRRKLSIAL